MYKSKEVQESLEKAWMSFVSLSVQAPQPATTHRPTSN